VTLRAVRPDVHERFVAVVQRGVARADREDAEHRARLRALPPLPSERPARLARPTKKKPPDS
jgi:hypothetical protein